MVDVEEEDPRHCNFTADTAAELMIVLNWLEPTDPPGAPVMSYKVEYSVDGTVWDPVHDVSEPGDSDGGLEAGYPYIYRVAAVNSVGQSGWSSTATDTTLRGAVPDGLMDLRSAVTPTELNVWLFWAPPAPAAEPMGDAITGYEVQGRPVAVAFPALSGGIPSPLAELVAVTAGQP